MANENVIHIGSEEAFDKLIAGDKPVKKLFLQPFVDRDTVVFSGLKAPNPAQMAAFVELLRPFVLEVSVRG